MKVEVKSAEDVQRLYEEETKEQFWTNPVCHGEIGFASWKYQKWLEDKIVTLAADREKIREMIEEKIKLEAIKHDNTMFYVKPENIEILNLIYEAQKRVLTELLAKLKNMDSNITNNG